MPGVLVAHCRSFAGDARSLVSAQSSCKARRANNKLEPGWGSVYLNEFEPESAEDAVIAVDGTSTPWRMRFSRRQAVEANWSKMKCTSTTARSGGPCLLLGKLNCIAAVDGEPLVIVSAIDGTRVRQITLPATPATIDRRWLGVDDLHAQTTIAVASADNTLRVFSAASGEKKFEAELLGSPSRVHISGDLVAVAGRTGSQVFDWVQGKQIADLKGCCDSVFFAGSRNRLFVHRASNLGCFPLSDTPDKTRAWAEAAIDGWRPSVWEPQGKVPPREICGDLTDVDEDIRAQTLRSDRWMLQMISNGQMMVLTRSAAICACCNCQRDANQLVSIRSRPIGAGSFSAAGISLKCSISRAICRPAVRRPRDSRLI